MKTYLELPDFKKPVGIEWLKKPSLLVTQISGRRIDVFVTNSFLFYIKGSAAAFRDASNNLMIIFSGILDPGLITGIVMHEVGHIVNGDLDETTHPLNAIEEYLREFKADKFMADYVGRKKAIECLVASSIRRPGNSKSMDLRVFVLVFGLWSSKILEVRYISIEVIIWVTRTVAYIVKRYYKIH